MKKKHVHGGDIYRYPNVLDFSANCNPYGMPEGVKAAAIKALERAQNYPDVSCSALRRALEQAEGVPFDKIICGNGAADLIFGLVLARKPKKGLLMAPAFAEYEQALASVGCQIKRAYLKEEEGFVPGEDFLDEITEDVDMVFFCNPNNPTGVQAEREYVRRVAEKCQVCQAFLVLDECFVDFLKTPEQSSMKPYLEEFPGMFLVKAFTKKYAMAGIRLGYGFSSDSQVLKEMRDVMQPWNVSVIAQEAGIAALREEAYWQSSWEKVREERDYLLKEMKQMGLQIYGSKANYIFFRGPEGLREFCLSQGISIRDCSNYEGLSSGFYRIAVRLREENEKLLQAFIKICNSSSVARAELLQRY